MVTAVVRAADRRRCASGREALCNDGHWITPRLNEFERSTVSGSDKRLLLEVRGYGQNAVLANVRTNDGSDDWIRVRPRPLAATTVAVPPAFAGLGRGPPVQRSQLDRTARKPVAVPHRISTECQPE